jgi:hypothetical protein
MNRVVWLAPGVSPVVSSGVQVNPITVVVVPAARKPPAEPAARAKAEQERAARQRAEQERAAREKAEQERAARERAEQERVAREKAEQERAARQRAEQERAARERAEQERAAREKAEQERLAREKAQQERLAREKAQQERLAREKAEQERLAREKAQQERLAREKAEQERLAREKAEQERLAREKAEQERLAREKAERQRLERERIEQERLARERAEFERLARERAEQERAEQERAEQERAEQERAEQERAEQERAERERMASVSAESVPTDSAAPPAPEAIPPAADATPALLDPAAATSPAPEPPAEDGRQRLQTILSWLDGRRAEAAARSQAVWGSRRLVEPLPGVVIPRSWEELPDPMGRDVEAEGLVSLPPEVEVAASAVMARYDMTVGAMTLITTKPDKGGAIWRIETDRGPRSLKLLHRQAARSLFSVGAQEYLVKQGARVPALVPTRSGDICVETDGKLWIVTDWVEPLTPATKIDVEGAAALCYGLGEFHRKSQGYLPPPGAYNASRLYRWPNTYRKILHKMGWFREVARAYQDMSAGPTVLALVDMFEQQARDAIARLDGSAYSSLIARGEQAWGIVHQDGGSERATAAP